MIRARERVIDAAGGRQQALAVVLFALALALEDADLTAVGTLAPQLQSHLHISDAQIGALAAVSTFAGAILTIPFGMLADRVRRVDVLTGALASWTVAMAAAALATSYLWLLLARVLLGVVTAAALPAIASMVGDTFTPGQRSRIYGYIYSGELLGGGFGFIVCGLVGGSFSWRWGFAVLIAPAAALAFACRSLLREPPRTSDDEIAQRPPDALTKLLADVEPRPGARLPRDISRMRLFTVIKYVLAIPSNRWLIAANAIGYLFFSGMRTFGVLFVRGHFGLTQGAAVAVLFVAGLGSVVGVLTAGRFADRLIERGHGTARVVVGGVIYVLAALILVPALWIPALALAVPLLILSGYALAAPNPPLDAARLDIVPGQLWGRAEGVRVVIRQSAQAAGPLLFGLLVDLLSGSNGNVFASGSAGQISAKTAYGLQLSFTVMLLPLLLNGVLLLLRPRHAYPHDVAAARAAERQPQPASASA